jgi:hypothetical protein
MGGVKLKKTEHEVEMVKCTLKIPRHIWRESKIRALDEDRDWQDIVSDALKVYLRNVPLIKKEARK